MKSVKSIALVGCLFLIAWAVGSFSVDATVVFLVFSALVMSVIQNQIGRYSNVMIRASLVGALLVIFVDPNMLHQSASVEGDESGIATIDAKPDASIVTRRDRNTGDVIVTYDGEYMRQQYEESKKERDENPELWRAKLRVFTESMKKAKEERERRNKELEAEYSLEK